MSFIVEADPTKGDFSHIIRKAIFLILLALIFDLFDGRVARMGGYESPFGREFDSLADLISFGLSALWRQKLRTILTLLGVVIGTATLVISVSIGEGVRVAINEQFRNESGLRQISVFPNNDPVDETYDDVPAAILKIPGEMSGERGKGFVSLGEEAT